MTGIHPNDGSAPIYALQTMLRWLTPTRQLAHDGIFGEETAAALSEFQRGAGLPVTGTADEETWNAVKLAYRQAQIEKGPAAPLEIILQPGQVLEVGTDNLHVFLIQTMLVVLGSFYPALPRPRVTGVLEARTAEAVKWLQIRADLPANGAVDKHTWRALVRQYRLTVGDGSGTFPVRIAQRAAQTP